MPRIVAWVPKRVAGEAAGRFDPIDYAGGSNDK
jgi:hypothetical protein